MSLILPTPDRIAGAFRLPRVSNPNRISRLRWHGLALREKALLPHGALPEPHESSLHAHVVYLCATLMRDVCHDILLAAADW